MKNSKMKYFIRLLCLLTGVILLLCSCGAKPETIETTSEAEETEEESSFTAEETTEEESTTEEETTLEEEEKKDLIFPEEDKIMSLANGLSAVTFKGDDGFEQFLESGGASSDAEVIGYLSGKIMADLGVEVVGNPFGCSVISAPSPNGDKLFGRNFDWYDCEGLIVLSYPDKGYASISTVNTSFINTGASKYSFLLKEDYILTRAALYCPLDGMNEQGLCVSVNMLMDSQGIQQYTNKPDLTTTTAIRLLLNKAANVDEAVELLKKYDFHSSFGYAVHLALSDRDGKSVVVEYINNQMYVTDADVVTNFYQTPGNKYGIGTQQARTRYDVLCGVLESKKTLTESDMADALKKVVKSQYGDGQTTQWSIVFNKTKGEAVYYYDENFDRSYKFSIEK